jgi:uncharacterized protein YunC (DUF1805 family)
MTQIGLNPKPFNFLKVKFQKTMIWKMTQIGLNPKPFNFLKVKFQKTIMKMTQIGLNLKPFLKNYSKVSKDDDMGNDTNC